MTPPLSIGDEVEIIGPSSREYSFSLGQKFKITEISPTTVEYSTGCVPWYPASSLRLVVEEPKIGDLVKIISGGYMDGLIGKIDAGKDPCGQFLVKGAWFNPNSLRKLTPEEITQHTAPKIEISHEEKIRIGNLVLEHMVKEAGHRDEIEEWLSNIEKSMQDIVNRQGDQKGKLDDIERRLSNLGPSHAELMTDVEALAEKIGAMQKSIDVLEGIQRGELPISKTGALAALASFGPPSSFLAAMQKRELEEAEKRKQKETCDEEDCKPAEGRINISIQRGKNEVHGIANSNCPAECLEWCEKVLDSMREG